MNEQDQEHGAPPFAAPAGLLNAEELAALRRFDECAQDGEGYDVPKEMMQRLAAIGVVQRRSGAYYQMTAFGQYALNTFSDKEIMVPGITENKRLIPDSECIQSKCACPTTGCWGKCHLRRSPVQFADKSQIIALANASGIDTDTDGDIWGSTNGALFKFVDALKGGGVEDAAKAIYRHFLGAEAHPWVDGGNSFKQDEARRYARAAIEAALPRVRGQGET